MCKATVQSQKFWHHSSCLFLFVCLFLCFCFVCLLIFILFAFIFVGFVLVVFYFFGDGEMGVEALIRKNTGVSRGSCAL